MRKIILLSIGFCFVFFTACEKTPDANYLPVNIGNELLAPWDATIYSADEMLGFFADTNYSELTKVYVAPGEGDGGDGSESNPFLSIRTAMEKSPEQGVLLCLKQGIYNQGTVDIKKYATKDMPFVVYSVDGKGKAIIDGEDKVEDIFRLDGAHIIIDGLTVKNCNGYGIAVFSPVENNDWGDRNRYTVIRNNIISHTGRDAVKSGNINFILIENNDISAVKHLVQPDDCIDGVAVYHSICRYNYLHDNTSGTGGYFKGGSCNNIWYGNLIENCSDTTRGEQRGGGLNIGGWGEFAWRDNMYYDYPSGYQQEVYNNIFVNCPQSGITIGASQQCHIFNNTFYNCGYGLIGKWEKTIIRIIEPNNIPSQDINIHNNIAYNDAGKSFMVFFADYAEKVKGGNIVHSHNSIFSVGADITWGYDADASEKIEDCMLENPQMGNFRLSTGSPAINSAINSALFSDDYFGTLRTGVYDRGAIED